MDERGSDAMESTMVAYTMLDNRVLSGFVSLLRPLVDATVMRKLSKGVEMVNRLGLEFANNLTACCSRPRILLPCPSRTSHS